MAPARKINGRKRHLLTDALGLPLRLVVHPANVQDRDGLGLVCARVHERCRRLQHLFAAAVAARERLRLEIVKRPRDANGFHLLPRRRRDGTVPVPSGMEPQARLSSSAASPSDSGAVGSAATAGSPGTSRGQSMPRPPWWPSPSSNCSTCSHPPNTPTAAIHAQREKSSGQEQGSPCAGTGSLLPASTTMHPPGAGGNQRMAMDWPGARRPSSASSTRNRSQATSGQLPSPCTWPVSP